MDSSSSSSSNKYDMFLNFRKEDTGRTFVSHLYRLLDQKGVRTYRDQNQLAGEERGRMSDEVSHAIEDSATAVVVISENYASSVWCLDVLAKITECLGSVVNTIPVRFGCQHHTSLVRRGSRGYEKISKWKICRRLWKAWRERRSGDSESLEGFSEQTKLLRTLMFALLVTNNHVFVS